jgi:uncharacterized protein involved in outer membrane biogenesis
LEPHAEGGKVKRLLLKLFSRRGVIAIGAILIALLVVHPSAGRLRWRISNSVSLAIGKRVQIGSVHLRFLPQLSFELDDFMIYDDPAFGSEPLLRAQDVTATLRLTSLVRGRFEVSSLSVSNASLNLTRDSEGRWNLEELLQRTAQISTAPTSSSFRESRPEFPYIEGSHARVNFKTGAEKTHFALTDAEFALWQQSEGSWGMRLKAQPIRTDLNLTDTGVINLTGSWRRGAPTGAPIEAAFQWKKAQAGQISKLITGEDKGWRGGVLISGGLSGTSAHLKIEADASVDDLGRNDIFSQGALPLAAHCEAQFSLPDNAVSDMDCSSPAGNGYVELKGDARGPGFSSYGLTLTANQVPAQSLVTVLQHTMASVPEKLSVKGLVNSSVQVTRMVGNDTAAWKGNGELIGLEIARGTASPVALEHVPFSIVPSPRPSLELGPVNIDLGRASQAQARASVSAAGYQASIRGDANVSRLLQLASAFGVPIPSVAAEGVSNVDLAMAGDWSSTPRAITGSAQLRNVRAQVRGLNAPLEIRAANLTLTADSVHVQNISAVAADTQWRGSMLIPRPCPTPKDCTLQFNLHAAEVSAVSLNKLLNPAARKQSWYKLLSFGDKATPYLLQARAGGKLSIDKLALGTANADQFSANVSLDKGKLTLSGFHCAAVGGKISGDWKADFSSKPPVYTGNGNVEDIVLDQLSDLMRNGWIEGVGSARYEFKTQGWGLQEVISNAGLNATFALKDGRFPRVVLTSKAGPLRVKSFDGELSLKDGDFSLDDAKLIEPDGIYRVSGTASLSGELKLKMVNEGAFGYDISGTLTRTLVSQLATTSARASLKP